ncbi:MAG: D-alanine--D-alanine ligase family protein [Culicoidibacterales bacterium]
MKIRVGVFFGGESVEHEVSVISANQAMAAIDTERYEVVPVYITKNREWYTGAVLSDVANYKDEKQLLAQATRVNLIQDGGKYYLYAYPFKAFRNKPVAELDIAFPVIHGTNGEDGSLQGYFEMLGLPYVGCNVGAAAVGQDKIYMKNILRDAGIPITDFVWFYTNRWYTQQEAMIEMVESQVGYPVIVKPANLGSSVGISLAKNRDELIDAIEEACQYDDKVLVEAIVANLVEMNCSVLGDFEAAQPSVLEEVMGSDEFLSYKDKYQGGSSSSKGAKTGSKTTGTGSKSQGMASTNRIIPARIRDEETQTIQTLAVETFQVLNSSGVARIDFLMDGETRAIYVNEINTIPGSLAFYLWQHTGMDFTELTNNLLALALKRERRRQNKTFSYETNLLANYTSTAGTKGSKGVKQ